MSTMFTIDKGTQSGSTLGKRLEGNKIHTVIFQGAEAVTVGNETTYDVIKLTFKNDDGDFEDSIFPPKLPEGINRTKNNYGGENPSQVEELVARLRHYIAALNPELDKKIESGEKSLNAKSWNELRALFVKSVEKGKGKEVQIKLLKKSNGMATMPGFVLSISKTGSVYMNTNFIGEKLSFTDKELKKIDEASKAKPTNVAESIMNAVGGNEKETLEDFDLEDLD